MKGKKREQFLKALANTQNQMIDEGPMDKLGGRIIGVRKGDGSIVVEDQLSPFLKHQHIDQETARNLEKIMKIVSG